MNRIEQLANVLKGHEVYIQTHNFPDPDAISSAFGLQELLEHFNIKSTIVYEGRVNKISINRMIELFNIQVFCTDEIPLISEDAYIVLVDSQKYNKNCTDLPGIEIACVDHHPIFNECNEYKYQDIRTVGACASIVADYFCQADIHPSEAVATALLYGIKVDTNDFGRGVEELDVEMYYRLFMYADQVLLGKMQLNSLEFSDLNAYGAAISSISIYKNIGFAHIPFDCPDGLIGVVSDFILAIDMVDFTVVYSERKEGYKFSVRSEEDELDAGKIVYKILSKHGGSGGGHSFMAGGFLPSDCLDSLGENKRQTVERDFLNEIFPNEEIDESIFIRKVDEN